MRNIFLILLFIPILFACSGENVKEYQMSKFGVKAEKGFNNSPIIAKAIAQITEECKDGEEAILLFEEGVYEFMMESASVEEYYISNHDQANPKTIGFNLKNLKNITIDGQGAEFLFHGRMLPLVLSNSENIVMKNFSIDFANPHISQVEIVENNVDKGEIIYKIAPWVEYKIENKKLIVYGENWEHTPSWGIGFEEGTKRIIYNTGDIALGVNNVEEISDRVIKSKWNDPRLVKGSVIAMRSYGRPTPGIFLQYNKDVKLNNVTVHYAEGMGLLAQLCENIELDAFNVCLRGESDPRYFTTQADATHFSGCKGVIISKNGLYENMMDDAINVHGTYLNIIEKISPTKVIARYMHSQSWGFDWGYVGEKVQFVRSKTMELLDGENIIKSIEANANDVKKEFVIEFEQPLNEEINAKDGYGIENLEWTPEVIFSNNIIRNNRARGALFSTPKKTLVSDNLFDHTSGSAILLCGDCNGWFETGTCRDVLIKNNTFITALTSQYQFTNGIISIYPEIPNLKDQTKYFHGGANVTGVVIEDNTFDIFDEPIVYAKSLDGLTFRGNSIKINSEYPPMHWNKHHFLFERVINVTIEDNEFEGGFDMEKDVLYKTK